MYFYQFSGASTHKLYSDFESLMKSVEYAPASNVQADKEENGALSNTNWDGAIVVGLLLLAVFVVVVVVKCRKNNVQEENALVENVYKQKQSSVSLPTVICQKCGHALPIDSVFCHLCGTKIEKEC